MAKRTPYNRKPGDKILNNPRNVRILQAILLAIGIALVLYSILG